MHGEFLAVMDVDFLDSFHFENAVDYEVDVAGFLALFVDHVIYKVISLCVRKDVSFQLKQGVVIQEWLILKELYFLVHFLSFYSVKDI